MSGLGGKKGPNLTAEVVINGGEMINNCSREQFIGKKYAVSFFYPADIT